MNVGGIGGLGWAGPVREGPGQRAKGALDVSLELEIYPMVNREPLRNFKLGSSCDKREFSRR